MNCTVFRTGVQTYLNLVNIYQKEWARHINTHSFKHNSIPHLWFWQGWWACSGLLCLMCSAHSVLRENGPNAFLTFENPKLLSQQTPEPLYPSVAWLHLCTSISTMGGVDGSTASIPKCPMAVLCATSVFRRIISSAYKKGYNVAILSSWNPVKIPLYTFLCASPLGWFP